MCLFSLPLLLLSLAGHAGELGELLQAALQHPQSRAAEIQSEAARAQQSAASGRYFGSAVLSAGWHEYEAQRVVGVYTPTTLPPPLIARDISQLGVSYSLPIDLAGVIAAARERARNDLAGAELAARQQTLLKLHQAGSAYHTLLAAEYQEDALARTRQRVEATHARILKEVELGHTAGVEARFAASELMRLAADSAALYGAIAQARADLAEAVGHPVSMPARQAAVIPAWEEIAPAATLPARLAEAKRDAARAQADESRRALYPALSLDANYFHNQGGGDSRDTWAVGGVVSLPLGVSQYREADARRLGAQAAGEQHKAALREAERQFATLHAAYDAAVADVRALEKEAEYREEVAAVQREMQRLGSQTLENLFRHERDLLDARYRLAQAKARAIAAWSAAQVLAGVPAATYIARMDAQ